MKESPPKLLSCCCVTESARRRVFFAFWPPVETLQGLDTLAADAVKLCGGRRMRRETLHMTLAFIGSVSPDQLAVLRQVAGKLEGEAFELQVDRVGYWPHNRIAWAGCSEVPSRQRRLHEDLAAYLADAGFSLDKGCYTPHVTLVRDVRCDNLPELTLPILWPVSEFVLVESRLQSSGAHYRVLDRWPLKSVPDKKISKGC